MRLGGGSGWGLHAAFLLLGVSLLQPVPTWTGHTVIWAPVKIRLPMSALVGLAATKVATLSLITSVLAKGKIKLLKSPRRKSFLTFSRLSWPYFSFFKKRSKTPKILPPVWAFPPGPIFPPGFHGLHGPHYGGFGPGFGHSFGPGFGPGLGSHAIPALLPPLPPPPPPRIPDFLKPKLVDPKDACILKLLCQFEFRADKLGGGDLEHLLFGLTGNGSKKQKLDLALGRRRRRRDSEFWINIQKKDKDDNHGNEVCENRYPTCFHSPIFSGSRLSLVHKRSTDSQLGAAEQQELTKEQAVFVEEVEKRIWELYDMLKAL